jgi:hypothetical protein
MNNNKKKEIADNIWKAKGCCENAFDSYKSYQPTLDHNNAIIQIDKALQHLNQAKEKILAEI